MKKGIMFSFITAIISGFSIFANAIFVSKTDPTVFSILRNTLVLVMFTLILLATNKLDELARLTRKQWTQLVAIGVIGGGIPFAMFFGGLSLIGAVNGNILQKTLFLWVALLAVPILKERMKPLQLVGYGVLFAGMFVFGGTYRLIPSLGSYLVFGATVLWAIENVVAKIALKKVSPLIVGWARMLFGIPCLLVASVFLGKAHLLFTPSSYAMAPLVVSSVFLVLYMVSWYFALSKAPATIVSSILVIAPVVTALAGSVVFHTMPTAPQGINFALLATGTILIAASFAKQQTHNVEI